MAIQKDCRDNIRQLVQFNTTNQLEKERLRVEWCGMFDRYEFESFWSYLFDKEPYQFLMADRKSDRFHKTFNPLEIALV